MTQPKPSQEQQDQVLVDRPGDNIYPEAKKDIDKVIEESLRYKRDLEQLVLKDMSLDLAVSDAMNHVATVLNYLPQDRDMEIESPEFNGEKLMTNFGRIAQLKLSMEYTSMLNMGELEQEAVLKAEVGRLWGDPNSQLLKKLLMDKAAKAVVPQPKDPTPYKKSK
jgi:hypothetical protein